MAEPLIPADVRALYEELLGEGGRVTSSDDPMWQDPTVQALLQSGLAVVDRRKPQNLAPTMPDTAFAHVLLQWQLAMDELRKKFGELQRATVRAERLDLRSRRQCNPGYSCVVVRDPRHVTALHAVLHRSAERDALEFTTGPYGETTMSGEPQAARDHYLPPEPTLLGRGGNYRVTIDNEFLTTYPTSAVSGFYDGEEIRVAQEKLPTKLLIVDSHTALVPLGPYGHPCLLIRDQGIVDAFVSYFELKWAEARPWAPPGIPIPEKENTQRQRILEALAAGLKDEAIARQQGVSVRTVRRHITALMQELGVTTRFAAGVAAVRRGWLSPAA